MLSSNPTFRPIAAACLVLLTAGCNDDAGRKTPPSAGGTPVANPAPDVAAPTVVAKVPPLNPYVDDGKPDYEIVPPGFEFGVIAPNERKEVEFEVFNRSDRPFKIADAHSECKCLVLTVDHAMIEPGKSMKVKAKINGTSGGAKSTGCVLRLSDPAKSKVRIDFHYSITPGALVSPTRLEFGRIETGQSSKQDVKITLHLPEGLPENPEFEAFIEHTLPITVTLDPPEISPVRHGFRDWITTAHLELGGNTPIASFRSQFVFKAKDDKMFRPAMVPVSGEIVTAWYFERNVLSFGTVDVGADEERTMRFFWPGDEPPAIQELTSSAPEFVVTSAVEKDRHCFVLTVKFKTEKAGRFDGEIRLKTSLSETADVLKVSARVN